MSNDDERSLIAVSPATLAILLGCTGLGGAGGYSAIFPAVQNEAILACVDKADGLFEVAVQHGEEILALQKALIKREAVAYDQSDHDKDTRTQSDRDSNQDRRINLIERRLDSRD